MQDRTIATIPIYLGPKMSDAIRDAFRTETSNITCRMISALSDKEIENIDASQSIKRDLRKLRDYTRLFKEDEDRHLNKVRALERDFLTCPLTYELARDPVLSPCCGHVFEKTAVHQSVRYQAPDAGGHRYTFVCPLCKQTKYIKEWNQSLPASNVVKRMSSFISGV